MNIDQKLLSIVYAAFTDEGIEDITEVYTANKDLVQLRHPMKIMSEELERVLYAVVEHIEFDGDEKIVQ